MFLLRKDMGSPVLEAVSEVEGQKKLWLEQTQDSLVLLVLGAIIMVFPILRLVGVFVIFSGVVLLFASRHIFGQMHASCIKIGAVLFSIGAALAVLASVGFTFLFFALGLFDFGTIEYPGLTIFPNAMVQSIPLFLTLDLAGTVFLSASLTAFTYGLQKRRGRVLLWLALCASIATSSLIFYISYYTYTTQVGPYWRTGNWDMSAAWDFERILIALNLLNLIPAGLFVAAFRSSRSRLNYTFDIPEGDLSPTAKVEGRMKPTRFL